MFKNEEYSSFLNVFIRLVLKHDKFTSFISLFRPLGYPIKPRPIYKPLSLKEYTIQEKYCDKRFFSYNGDMSINFLSILCHQFARMA